MNVFIYRRRSQDKEDRQILSLENQSLAMQSVENFSSFTIVDDIKEEVSAKAPYQRPKFNSMCDRIEKGGIDAVVCWQLDRLSRNPVDGGRIIWAVQQGLKIITPTQTYTVNDITAIYNEFAFSHQFINKLRKNTAAGTLTKIVQGWAPQIAPIGYLNTPEKPQGLRTIEVDSENNRFNLVRKMWDLLLTGKYNPEQILIIATDKWGLKQRNGQPMSRSQIYKLFSNPFYAGFFIYNNELHGGKHKSMITVEEYELAQRILGSRGKPIFINREFAYSRWIHCVCGGFITAEERYRRRCPRCENKYNVDKHYDVCPKCKIALSTTINHTVSYHCSNPKCTQPSVSLKNLEIQLDRIIASINLPEDYARWALEMLKKQREKEVESRQEITQSVHAQIITNRKTLDALTTKWSSPNNTDGSLMSDEDYKTRKNKLEIEYKKLCQADKEQNEQQGRWIQVAERTFRFAVNARHWFNHGTKLQKRIIVQAIGSDPILENGLLHINLLEPYKSVQNMAILGNEEITWFGPGVQKDTTTQKDSLALQNLIKYSVTEIFEPISKKISDRFAPARPPSAPPL